MSGNKTAGLDFDDQFEQDVVGDGPAAADYKNAGVPLKYAAIKYGTKGPDCGYAQAGVDLSNLWAKKGSASYATPDDGASYVSTVIVPNGGSRTAGIRLYVVSLNPLTYGVGPAGSATSPALKTFNVPAGMQYFRAVLTFASGTAAASVTQTTAWTKMTTVGKTMAEIISDIYAYASGTHEGTYTCKLDFSADGAKLIYTGTTSWRWLVDGSV